MAKIPLIIIILLAALLTTPTSGCDEPTRTISPANGASLDTSLSVVLSWPYPAYGPGFTPALKTKLEVSLNNDLSKPLISVELPEGRTSYRLSVAPKTTYYWRITPFDEKALMPAHVLQASFTTAAPRTDTTEDDRVRYRNPRREAYWTGMRRVSSRRTNNSRPGSTAKRCSIQRCRSSHS